MFLLRNVLAENECTVSGGEGEECGENRVEDNVDAFFRRLQECEWCEEWLICFAPAGTALRRRRAMWRKLCMNRRSQL